MSMTPLTMKVYTGAEVQGVKVLVAISCISMLAVVLLLCVLALTAYRTRKSSDEYVFVRTHIAAYFLCLLLCEVMRAVGSIISARWVQSKGVYAGNMCILQGVLKQTSDIGTALWTLIMAIHTFCVLFLELKTRPFVLWVGLLSGWSAIAAFVILGPATVNVQEKGPFYTISDYSCFISPNYPSERITLDYLFSFLTAVISVILYALVMLRLRGNIIRNGWRLKFRKQGGSASWRARHLGDKSMSLAKQMLLYPIVYILIMVPDAIAQFASWAGNKIPFQLTIFTAAIVLLSGLVNVVLFLTTRQNSSELNIGRWLSCRNSNNITPSAVDEVIPRATQSSEHRRSDSLSSTETAVGEYSNRKLSRAGKRRPPSIVIRRDSLESFYSVYDEEALQIPHHHFQQPLGSSWSPDGPPHQGRWRSFIDIVHPTRVNAHPM